MKRTILLAFFAASLMIFNSCETETKKEKETPGTPAHAEETTEERHDETTMEDDGKLMIETIDDGMMKIKASEAALEMGTNPEVRKLAKMMVDDHNTANNELRGLAAKKNVEFPTTLSSDNQSDVDDLRKKAKGKDFDAAYAKMMVDDHEKEIDDFRKNADKAKDAELKTWYTAKIPGLEHHLGEAKRVHDMVK